jgi:hypothetical protein
VVVGDAQRGELRRSVASAERPVPQTRFERVWGQTITPSGRLTLIGHLIFTYY